MSLCLCVKEEPNIIELMKILKIALATAGVFAVVWIASIVLAKQYTWWVYDNRLGLAVPRQGSSVFQMTEGFAVSHYAEFGFNACLPYESNSRFILLHGDSYIEAFQLPDARKPDAVLSRMLGDGVRVHAIGRSGAGLPSMILRAIDYERVLGVPEAHVFFVASGIRNDLFQDTGGSVRVEGGFSKTPIEGHVTGMSGFRNKLFFNFVTAMNKIWRDMRNIKKREISKDKDEAQQDVDSEMRHIRGFMNKSLKGRCIVVYCPNLPRIENGIVLFDDPDADDAAIVKNVMSGDDFIDVTPALVECYKHGFFARGFDNLGGPCNGHLNGHGVEFVFSYIAKVLKERYGL